MAVLEDTQATFDILRADLRSMGGHLVSPIESRLDSFTRDLSFAQAPILLLLAQVVGIALFYIVVVSGVLVAQRREELFSMRSRGASLFQVLGLTAIEGLVLAVVSAIIGPLIAAGVISLLGYTAIFAPLTGGRAIDVTLTDDAFLLAAGGAIVAVVFMLVPLTIASRTRVLSERLRGLTRPSGPNALQRYYLDVALVLVAAGLIFEADLRGTVFERNSVGGLSADPLLLSTPILFRARRRVGDPAHSALGLSPHRLDHLRPLPALDRGHAALRLAHRGARGAADDPADARGRAGYLRRVLRRHD